VLRNTPAADPPWPVRRLLRGRKIEYIETRRRCALRPLSGALRPLRALALLFRFFARR
jgi:hypothetical protein